MTEQDNIYICNEQVKINDLINKLRGGSIGQNEFDFCMSGLIDDIIRDVKRSSIRGIEKRIEQGGGSMYLDGFRDSIPIIENTEVKDTI